MASNKNPRADRGDLVIITGLEHSRLTREGFRLRGVASSSAELKKLVEEIYEENPRARFALDGTKEIRRGVYFVDFNRMGGKIAIYTEN